MSQTPNPRHLYDDLSDVARRLARVPRIGRLIGMLPESRVRALGRTATAADVFWEVYTFDTADGRGDCGLLADGLKVEDARRLAWRGSGDPPVSFRGHQIRRSCAMLGAIAFELMARTDPTGRPTPAWNGIDTDLDGFRCGVLRRLVDARAWVDVLGQPEDQGHFFTDWDALLTMDSHGLKHLLFSTDVRDQRLRWADITTMAFFAAYWACRWSTPAERAATRTWVPGPSDETNAEFTEFWTFAAHMPETAVDGLDRYRSLFAPLYDGSLRTTEDHPVRSTELIYRSWNRMEGTQARKDFLAEFPRLREQHDPVALELDATFEPIPAGTFWMGAADDEEKARENERPRHQVNLSAFRMNRYTATNTQYELFDPGHGRRRGRYDRDYLHPLNRKGSPINDNRRPVVNVSWYDAWCFAKWAGYHLPSEAQWEYACRGGAPTYQIFHFGATLSTCQANFNAVFDVDVFEADTYLKRTMEVGSYPANGYGLYDMHGNVWEWCLDWYDEEVYRKKAAEGPDPVNEDATSARVIRGGSFYNFGYECRSACRVGTKPDINNRYHLGFRLAAVPASLEPGKRSEAEATEPGGAQAERPEGAQANPPEALLPHPPLDP